MTDKELGRNLKLQFPEYEYMSDEEVGRKHRAKYSAQEDDGSLFGNWWKIKKAVSATERRNAETVNNQSKLDSHDTYTNHHRKEELKSLDHDAAVKTRESSAKLHEHAMERAQTAHELGRDPATHQAIVAAQAMSEMKVAETKQTARDASAIQITQHKAMKRIDRNVERDIIRDKIEVFLRVALVDNHKVIHLQNRILEQIDKKWDLIEGELDTPRRADKLATIENTINGLQGVLNGLTNIGRPAVPGIDGQGLQGNQQGDTNGRGLPGHVVEEGNEQGEAPPIGEDD